VTQQVIKGSMSTRRSSHGIRDGWGRKIVTALMVIGPLVAVLAGQAVLDGSRPISSQ
jgi:hypothetical protein